MSRIVSVAKLRGQLASILDQVADERKFLVIERRGKAVAALISLEELEQVPEYRDLEDRIDEEAADAAHREISTEGTVPWREIQARRGLA